MGCLQGYKGQVKSTQNLVKYFHSKNNFSVCLGSVHKVKVATISCLQIRKTSACISVTQKYL